jgi:hypothetical protein
VQEYYVGIVMTKNMNELIKKTTNHLINSLKAKKCDIEREDSSSRVSFCIGRYSKFIITTVNVGMNHMLLAD